LIEARRKMSDCLFSRVHSIVLVNCSDDALASKAALIRVPDFYLSEGIGV
jgi:hypothetical protein